MPDSVSRDARQAPAVIVWYALENVTQRCVLAFAYYCLGFVVNLFMRLLKVVQIVLHEFYLNNMIMGAYDPLLL